jgi:hypothetical protein
VSEEPEHDPQPTETLIVPPLAEGLHGLVKLLYSEPSVVDVLTLDQFIFRYKFSGLGATAVADMERAQRITRAVGDHGQIGLAEFHIGLIYLHWGQFFGAIKYFEDAQRYWQFAKLDVAVSLAQFAQGVCQHHAYHYENALANYGKVQRTLIKVESNGVGRLSVYMPQIESNLAACREDVVQKIRTLGEGEPTTFRAPLPPASAASDTDDQPTKRDDETAVSDITTPRTPTSQVRVAPLPISHLPPVSFSEFRPEQSLVTEEISTVPQVKSFISKQSPIPQHANQSDSLVWYEVADREELDSFLPNIQADTVLLVDTHTELYTCAENDLVIVNPADAEGSISLTPQQAIGKRPTRIYLAEVEEQFSFKRDPITADIQFTTEEVSKVKINANQPDLPIFAEDIIGIVIGIWSKLHPAQKQG